MHHSTLAAGLCGIVDRPAPCVFCRPNSAQALPISPQSRSAGQCRTHYLNVCFHARGRCMCKSQLGGHGANSEGHVSVLQNCFCCRAGRQAGRQPTKRTLHHTVPALLVKWIQLHM